MNEYRVLYYPDFSPDPAWLRKVLLLFDAVVRIVPEDVHPDDPDDLVWLQDVCRRIVGAIVLGYTLSISSSSGGPMLCTLRAIGTWLALLLLSAQLFGLVYAGFR